MKRFISLFLFPAVLLLAGCDLPSGTDPDADDGGAITDPGTDPDAGDGGTITAADLVGTWAQQVTNISGDVTYAYTIQLTFYGDGTYVELRDNYSSSSGLHSYEAVKGTYSLDAEGDLAMAEWYDAYPESFVVPAEGDWSLYEHSITRKRPVLIIENRLYINSFYKANGPVNGIVGEWISQDSDRFWNDLNSQYETTYYKSKIIFNSDDTYEYAEYESNTEAFDPPPDTTETGTYIYADGTLTITPDGEAQETGKVTIYNNNYLIFGDETSATAYAYIKQP